MAEGKRRRRPSFFRIRNRKILNLNIGLIIFFVILVYILISIIIFFTSKTTEVYEVRMGSLSENSVYTGIALRDEQIVDSDYAGTVNYYNKEGDRLSVNTLAYSVDENGEISDYAASDSGDSSFSDEDYASFRNDVISFADGFDPSLFSSVYDFKSEAESAAQKASNRKILSDIGNVDSTSLHTVNAPASGEIVYSSDNLDGLTFDDVTASDFNRSGYRRTQMENGSTVGKGDAVYKLVTDENWSVAIQVPDEEKAKELVDDNYVEVRFLKNQTSSWAKVTSKSDENGNYFVNLRFSNSMESFISDRFVNIEIVTDEQTGLKVPNTSITRGNFFLVPKDYVFEGTDGQDQVLLEVYDSDGSRSTQKINVNPYSEKDDYYYLDDSVLRAGQILDKPDSSDQYTLGKQDELIGVYYINKGYPDFRQVNILFQNEEYSIVESDSLYGLQEYDYIVLHADSINFDSYNK